MNIKALEKGSSAATSSPKAAVKFLLDTLYVYQQGDDGALGYLGFVLSKNDLVADENAPSKFMPSVSTLQSVKRLKDPRYANSILALMGGTWQKDYKDAKPDAYTLPVTKEDDPGNGHRVFLKSGGRDNPFPVTLKQSGSGAWKVTEGLGTICMDVRKTKTAAEDI
ncbi:MAG: hypothetical protein GYA24_25030 [Candidatus Lokiarchaeota archaeon]|nr:hypothetical protein [Candidatus Lokiarchaeota archaeon]